jgi:hypothetical protein
MTEEKTFEPITTQEEFDERIKARLAREREKWEKDSGVEDLKAQLEAKDEEISSLKREHGLENTRHAVETELTKRGITDEGRRQRIMKLVEWDAIEVRPGGEPDPQHITSQLEAVDRDVPELTRSHIVGAGSGGSSKPVLQPQERPITRDELESMNESEINSRWDQVKGFLAGER